MLLNIISCDKSATLKMNELQQTTASTMRPVCRMWHVVLQLFYTEYCSINVTAKYIKNYNVTIQNTLKIKRSSLRSILDDLFWKTK